MAAALPFRPYPQPASSRRALRAAASGADPPDTLAAGAVEGQRRGVRHDHHGARARTTDVRLWTANIGGVGTEPRSGIAGTLPPKPPITSGVAISSSLAASLSSSGLPLQLATMVPQGLGTVPLLGSTPSRRGTARSLSRAVHSAGCSRWYKAAVAPNEVKVARVRPTGLQAALRISSDGLSCTKGSGGKR